MLRSRWLMRCEQAGANLAGDLAFSARSLSRGPLRWLALGVPVPFPAEALPHWARQHGSKQESADNTGDDKREERGHPAVVQKAD